MNIKKSSLTVKVLKVVLKAGFVTVDSFFPAKYPESRAARRILGLDASYRVSKPVIRTILWRLQKEGLVERRGLKWHATKLGRQIMGKHAVMELPEEDGVARLVIFDVPEKYRGKRQWLRRELAGCGFELLQRSVWLGYRPLSAEFFKSLGELNLRKYVHIFSIDKRGTLKKY